MKLTDEAVRKLGGDDATLYQELQKADPTKQFTSADQILIQFAMPEMEIPNGPNHRQQALANHEAIIAASEQGKAALERIEGLTIYNYFRGLGAASVSGSAQAIAAALELPEIEAVTSFKGVTLRPASGHER